MRFTTLCLLTVAPSLAVAQSFVSSSVGGYQGMLGVGGGYDLGNLSSSATLGYTESKIDIYSLNLRVEAKTQSYTLNPVVGLTAIASLDKNTTFIVLPSQYPKRYYPATGLYWAPSVGVEYRTGQFSYRAELATLDYYVELYYRGQGYVSLSDITTPMVSVKYYLN